MEKTIMDDIIAKAAEMLLQNILKQNAAEEEKKPESKFKSSNITNTKDEQKKNISEPVHRAATTTPSPFPNKHLEMYKDFFGLENLQHSIKVIITDKNFKSRVIFCSVSNILNLPLGPRTFFKPGALTSISIPKPIEIKSGNTNIKFGTTYLPVGHYKIVYLGHPINPRFEKEKDLHFFEFIAFDLDYPDKMNEKFHLQKANKYVTDGETQVIASATIEENN